MNVKELTAEPASYCDSENIGTGPLEINSITFAGVNPGEFSANNNHCALKIGDGLPGSALTKQCFNFSNCFLRNGDRSRNLLPRLLFYACPLVLFFLVVAV